jgi:hypothetical protein
MEIPALPGCWFQADIGPAHVPERVVRRGFAGNAFQVIARLPAGVAGLGERGGSFSLRAGSAAVCVSSLLHPREAAGTPQAVRRLWPKNAAHSQFSGEAASLTSAVGGLRFT